MNFSRNLRSILAGISGVLGVLLILGGGLLIIGDRAIFNSDYFAAHVSESLGDERVATYVGRILTDVVVEGNEDLILVRPVIQATAKAIVASPPFRAVAARGVKRGHQLLATEGGHEVLLSVSDVGVILSNALSAYPEIAGQIPEDAVAVLGIIEEGPLVEISGQVIRTGQKFPLPPHLVFWVGMALLVGAIFLARDHDLALLRAGLSIMAISLAILIIIDLGELVLSRMGSDQALSDALAGIWNTFMRGFWSKILVLGGLGLMMAAAGTAFPQSVKLDSIWDRTRRVLFGPASRPLFSLIRGFLLTIIGFSTILHPGFASRILVIVAGSLVCFLGLRELCRLVVNPEIRDSRKLKTRTPGPRRHWPWLRRVGAGITMTALLAAGVIYLTQPEAEIQTFGDRGCHGSLELCDRPLDDIVFAGTHNAMGAAEVANWMFPNHRVGIPSQLRDGIRAFMLDVMSGSPAGDDVKTDLDDGQAIRAKLEPTLGAEGFDAALRIRERLLGVDETKKDLYLCHGFCELGYLRLVPALVQFRDFLVLNPGEVIILIFEDTAPPNLVAEAFAESGLLDLVYRGSVEPPWPTLGEMVKSNQRVLVLAENDSAGVPWYHQAFEVCQETPYHFSSPEEFSCEPNRGGTAGSLMLMNHWVTTPPTSLPSIAAQVNAHDFLMGRVEEFRNVRGKTPNIIAVDFYRSGDLVEVVRQLNQAGLRP